MKKIISVLMIIAFALCFASCKAEGPNPDNWHNNSGINKLLALKIEGMDINAACAFTNDGIEIYYNDKLEKELFCTVEYEQPDENPGLTAAGATAEDVNGDGSTDIILNYMVEGGSIESIPLYWTPGARTFKAGN